MSLTRRAALAGLLFAACGTAEEAAIERPAGSDELVLRVQSSGGLVAPSAQADIPEFSLMGDGLVVTIGPQIAIYPPPALPSLVQRTVTSSGVDRIVDAADDAGLTSGDGELEPSGERRIADAPTTVFTTVARGRRSVVSAYALGIVEPETGERADLQAFRDRLNDLPGWLGPDEVSDERRYAFDALRVFVGPPAAPDPGGLQPSEEAWPLSTPPATFGSPDADRPDRRCGVVAGADLERLLPLAQRANTLTAWTSAGTSYGLSFRPLLPDESGC